MKYRAIFSPLIRILLWIISITVVAAAVAGILTLCGVHLEMTTAQAKLFLYCSPMAIIAILLNTIHYKITATHIELKFAFGDVLGGRIKLDNVLNIVKTNGKLYISYLWKGVDPVISELMISPKKFQEMIADIKSKNANVVYIDEDER